MENTVIKAADTILETGILGALLILVSFLCIYLLKLLLECKNQRLIDVQKNQEKWYTLAIELKNTMTSLKTLITYKK